MYADLTIIFSSLNTFKCEKMMHVNGDLTAKND